MRNPIFCIALLAALAAFAGCTSDGPGEGAQAQVRGTGDSGGGNSYKGKPLESYIQNPSGLPSVRANILPVQNALHENHQDLEKIFFTMLNQKAWYFVPGPLRGLPNDKIGSAVPTDQVALQDFDAVWVDADIFGKMSDDDQSKLVLHEVLMGLKLLRFDSYRHSCLALAPDRTLCDGASDTKMGSPSDLTETDYAEIRSTVPEIFRSYLTMKYEDWEDLMGRGEFGFSSREFKTRDQTRQLSFSAIQDWLRSSEAIGSVPTYGFDFEHLMQQHPELRDGPALKEVNWDSHERCSVKFDMQPNQITFQLSLGGRPLSISTPGMGDSSYQITRRAKYGQAYWQVGLASAVPFSEHHKLGDRMYDVILGFGNEGRLGYVELQEMACSNSDCTEWTNPENALTYTCAVASQLKYK